MKSNLASHKRILGVFALAMINVAAIVSLRNLSIMVEYGFGCIFYYVVAALIFFIPTAFVCAELATGWPKSGGVYLWVAEAFGPPVGFIAIWFAWMLSIAWFPTVLTFTASSLAYIFKPELIENNHYMIITMLSIFWIATFINFSNMKTSSWVSSIGVILGTIIPGLLIIGLGITWLWMDKDLKIDINLQSAFPSLKLSNMVFFVGVLLSLAGMEMSAFHAREAKNPKRDYPIAMIISSVIILSVYILGSLSIAFVVSPRDINLFAGLMQAFNEFFKAFNLLHFIPWLAFFAVLGSLAGINTWIIGPAKGILESAKYGYLPPWMQKVNKNGMPVGTLLVQAVLGSLIALVFYFMPSVNAAFWIITALTVIFAMVMYVLIFAACIRLRYTQPDVKRHYRVPGGMLGLWIIAGIGIISSLWAFFVAFIPPAQLDTGSLFFYESYLLGGLVLLTLPPVLFIYFKKPHWHAEEEPEEDLS